MIRINLLAAERDRGKKKAVTLGTVGQKLTIGCSLILVLGGLAIGWRYWTVNHDSAELDKEIAAAQQETTRLHSVIEQLRKGQTGPVHMLDQISRALPPMLWLTEVKQTATDIVIDGKCTSPIGVSDFVANLEASGYFKRSIDIVSTSTEAMPQPPGELIKFSIKAVFQQPGDAKAPAAPVAAH